MSAAVPLPSPAALGFHPADPAFVADPYPALRVLRDRHRVVYDEPSSQWLVFRHDDVNSLKRDRRLGRSYLHETTHEAMGRKPPPAWHEPFTTLNGNGMLDREPDHTRLRRLVLKAFVPATVETLRPRIPARHRDS
jgi:cytochrome P450